MVRKVGQRRFLLKLGYTNEQLDGMSPSTAHGIISDVEKAQEKERQAIREAEEEKVRKQQFKKDVQEAVKEVLDQKILDYVRKEAIKEFAATLKEDIAIAIKTNTDALKFEDDSQIYSWRYGKIAALQDTDRVIDFLLKEVFIVGAKE